jgi:hypothetical protein
MKEVRDQQSKMVEDMGDASNPMGMLGKMLSGGVEPPASERAASIRSRAEASASAPMASASANASTGDGKRPKRQQA